MNLKRLKDAAALVGAIAGIVTGLEKIKSTIIKWKGEVRDGQREKKVDDTVKLDKQ